MSNTLRQPAWLPTSFNIMAKPRGSICNMDCDYCYFLSKEQMYPMSSFKMPNEILEEYTRQYIQALQVPQITFTWQGGEPTLIGLDFYKSAVVYQKKYAPPGIRIDNALQTNGTLLDDAWCDFFKENNFLIGISIDGPQKYHDVYRKNKSGESSFQEVTKGVNLLKKHGIEFNVLCTVNAANAEYPLEVYRYFRDDLGVNFIQYIPIVERDNQTGYQKGNKVTTRSITGKQYGSFLISIFNEWFRNDIGTVFVQVFDVALGKWMGIPGGLCVFEEICGLGLALEHTGDLYSCDHFVEPKHKLGNIIKTEMIDMATSYKQYKFGMDKRDTLPKFCLECEFRFACNGGCPKNRISHTPEGEYGLNFLCEGYKAFFNHINPYMCQMTELIRTGHLPAAILQDEE